MKKYLFVCLLSGMFFSVQAQQTVTIDVKQNNKQISPLIYGANNPTTNATAIRWGGNRTTTYNWENNFSNAGNDWNHVSDNYFTQGKSNTEPAEPIINLVKTANERKQYTLITLQAAGFVARDGSGGVSSEQAAPSNRWDTVVFRKQADYTLQPDKTDGTVYIDEMIHYLNTKLGEVGNGGIDAFGIDNEPALWKSTHPLIRPKMLLADEFFYKTIELSKVVKELSPQAEVYGPMFYGWWDARNFPSINYPGGKGYSWFVDFYLDSLQKASNMAGQRLLDVLAVHWYPETKGRTTNRRIVNLDGSVTTEQLIAPDMIEARLQAPRVLWDSTFTHNGGTNSSTPVVYIHKLQKAIDTFYPDTKLAFTEFKYDAEFHFSGGLSLVDVLGIFGREGVYMASKWDPINNDFGGAAYSLYLNYDGNGSSFGTTSVQADASDNAILSSFASVDEDNNLHIIIVNKSDVQQSTTFAIDNGYYDSGIAYGFDQHSSAITQWAAPVVANNSFSYTLPAYSASHIVLQAKPSAGIVQASIQESAPNTIICSTDEPIVLTESLQNLATDWHILYADGTSAGSVESYILIDETHIALQLSQPLLATDSIVYVHWQGSALHNALEVPLAATHIQLHNELAAAPLFIHSAELSKNGKIISMSFSKALASKATADNNVSVTLNGEPFAISSTELSADARTYSLHTATRITRHDTVQLICLAGITAEDATQAPYIEYTLSHGGPNYSAEIDSIIFAHNFGLTAYLHYPLDAPKDLADYVHLYQDGESMDISVAYRNQSIVITTATPMYADRNYTLSFDDTDDVRTVFGGYVGAINNRAIANTLPAAPAATLIPARIEAEQFAYHQSTMKLEPTNDEGGGEHIGFISAGNKFGYTIQVPQAGDYSLYVRHAGNNTGNINVYVDNIFKTSLFIPATQAWTTWDNSSVALPIEAGEHTIELFIEKAGFNINYITLVEGISITSSEVKSSSVASNGKEIILAYTRKFAALPAASLFLVTADGEAIEINSVEFNRTDSTVLRLQLAETILQGQEVKLTTELVDERTQEQGTIEPITNYEVKNNSKERPLQLTAVQQAEQHYCKTPLQVGEEAELRLPAGAIYTIYNLQGAVHSSGMHTAATVSFAAQGVYIIEVQDATHTYTQKIIVKK